MGFFTGEWVLKKGPKHDVLKKKNKVVMVW
jgi:hypothetical protein